MVEETSQLLPANLLNYVRNQSGPCLEILKVVLVLLLWQFGTGLSYNLFMTFIAYHFWFNYVAVFINGVMVLMFLFLSPTASFVADVKFTRFKTLKWSTYCTILSSFVMLLSVIVLVFSVRDFNSVYIASIIFLICSIILCISGRIFFLSNVIQFSTDQLRDNPTRYSVLFIYAYYWCDMVSSVLTKSTNIPRHEIFIDDQKKLLSFDYLKISLYIVILITSISLLLVVLLILYKKKHWFNTEGIRGNPYTLTWNVVKFASQHSKPLQRSAFTFCENIIPSRLDFGKRRYGGPFTTEQVEDVKVLLNLLKIFICIGPVFFMDFCATMIVKHHHPKYNVTDIVQDPLKAFFLYNDVLSSLLAVLWVPILYKLSHSKWFPNMFKRIGLSILLLLAVFLTYLLYEIIGDNGQNYSTTLANLCIKFGNTTYYTHLVQSPVSVIILVLHSILSSLYLTLLHTSVWSLICCQSPQFMKGFVFGLFYTVQAFFRFLAILVLFIILSLKSKFTDCNLFLKIINICIGTLVFFIYVAIARKYKYRKRDDICNIHQYAEDYYFKKIQE